ncbi:hypothetical protein B0T26DRAFT_758043 [Lasiosphaeria miniovina]|uniref:Apple domain-containing protein n=1 Tax=Lasiosphaeria miniovina TaxID=1954250 RepID=A0AA39ZR07_9PEZI|nr:uncharacterized protein B0T26DRAFT_758043 [Lasiosphaeria miniovina]KAK0702091.1 hypothetical protein B0T26DRAFT_758043 [Lasiosphaeria miniovina]
MERRQGGGGGGGKDSAPCPGGNGTQIGTAQQFTVLCNSNVGGDVINRTDAFDFTTCVDICSSFHPKCEGVSFDGSKCFLRNNLNDRTRPARRFDAAIGTFPGASSNCATLSGAQQVSGTSFAPMCGFILAGSDISQNFAPTFQDCMTQCSKTTGCAALSFDASQNQGFKNCYLKSAVTDSANVAPDSTIDSAMLSNAALAPAAPASPAASSPAVAPPPAPTTAATPAPAPVGTSASAVATPPAADPGSSGGVVFFTPPGGSPTPVATTPVAATPAPSTPINAVPTAAETSSLLLPLPLAPSSSQATFLFPSSITGAFSAPVATTDAAALDSSGATSNAWIAAPVVGSVAALALIVVSFIMLKRRRRRGSDDTSSSGSGSSRRNMTRSSPVTNLLSTWLPGSPRRKMGNFSQVTGKQPMSRNSIRDSVPAILRPGGGGGGMERLDDIEEDGANRDSTPVYGLKNGKAELRNSLNGLGQNRWS